MQEPRIETIGRKLLVGKSTNMSLSDNKTFELWKNFMPQRKEIKNVRGNDLYSVEIFPENYFSNFDTDARFEKWAAIEVSDHEAIAADLEKLIIPAGKYAVFVHKGPASEGARTYNFIFREWLPASNYVVDSRPHFALMGEKYKVESADSEEELWVPVRER